MGKLGTINFNSDTCGFTLQDIANALNSLDGIFDNIAEGEPWNGAVTTGTNNAYVTTVTPNTMPILDNGFLFLKIHATNTSPPAAGETSLSVNGETGKKVYFYNNTGIVKCKGGELRAGNHYLVRQEMSLNGGLGGYIIINPSISIPTAAGVPALSANVATVFSAITWDNQRFMVDSEQVNLVIGVRFTMAAPLPSQIYITIPHSTVPDTALNALGNTGYECFAREGGASLATKVIWWCDSAGRLRFVKENGANFVAGAAALFLQGGVRSAA